MGSAQLEGSEGQQPEAEPEAARACSSPRAVDATAEAPDAMEVEAEEAGEPVSAGGEEPLGTEDGEGEGDGDGAEAAAEEEPNSAGMRTGRVTRLVLSAGPWEVHYLRLPLERAPLCPQLSHTTLRTCAFCRAVIRS